MRDFSPFLFENCEDDEQLISFAGFGNIVDSPTLVPRVNVPDSIEPLSVGVHLRGVRVSGPGLFIRFQNSGQLRAIPIGKATELCSNGRFVKRNKLTAHSRMITYKLSSLFRESGSAGTTGTDHGPIPSVL